MKSLYGTLSKAALSKLPKNKGMDPSSPPKVGKTREIQFHEIFILYFLFFRDHQGNQEVNRP